MSQNELPKNGSSELWGPDPAGIYREPWVPWVLTACVKVQTFAGSESGHTDRQLLKCGLLREEPRSAMVQFHQIKKKTLQHSSNH